MRQWMKTEGFVFPNTLFHFTDVFWDLLEEEIDDVVDHLSIPLENLVQIRQVVPNGRGLDFHNVCQLGYGLVPQQNRRGFIFWRKKQKKYFKRLIQRYLLKFNLQVSGIDSTVYFRRTMRKILVTGGAGFIGSHTVTELIHAGFTPIIIDNFSNTDERILDGLKHILGQLPVLYREDCTDAAIMENIFQKEKPEAVIHFAAFKAVGESVEQPLKYYRNNLSSLILLLELMKKYQVRDLVFSSSCTVYGQPDQLPVTEKTPQKEATSPYGYTKQVCERIIQDFVQSEPNFRAVLLRYFNPIGAHHSGQIGELPFGVPGNLVPYITQTGAGLREKLTIHGNDYDTVDGTCIRDFIHVTDLAKAHVKSLEWLSGQASVCEVFNLGQGIGNTVLEVVQAFEKVSGKKLPYSIGPRRAGDVEKVWADVTKSKTMLNWKTELTLEQALDDAWRWQQHIGKN